MPEAIGAGLVGLGVFAEVATAALAAREARRAELEKEERIALAEKATADSNLARVRLEKELSEVSKRQHQRVPPRGAFSALKGRPPKKVVIRYQPEDNEAYMFAMFLMSEITAIGWGFPDGPSPIASDADFGTPPVARGPEVSRFMDHFPAIIRAGGGPGLGLVVQSADESDKDFVAFRDAVQSCTEALNIRVGAWLPVDEFVLLVGPKPTILPASYLQSIRPITPP